MAPTVRVSRTVKDRLAEDDAEIARLERKLGLKKGGKSKAAHEDGLDELLGGFEEDEARDTKKRRSSGDSEWLQEKRRKVESKIQTIDGAPEQDDSDFEGFSDAEEHSIESDESVESSSDAESEHASEAGIRTNNSRENPYVPPSTDKYVPPSLRKSGNSDDEAILRLKRRVQGLINRLAESNLQPILQSIEALYAENARQHVTGAIIDTLLALVADEATLTDTFIVLHGGFIAALYRSLGVDFGAQLLEQVVTSLDAQSDGKKAANLVSLLATMYNFEVISCQIIYELIRQYIDHFTENDAELLLRVIRTCGPELRQDDPSALRDVMSLIQKKVTDLGGDGISVRQQFLIDTMHDLKNNRLRPGMASSASRSEFMSRMKKLLGTIKSQTSKPSEPLSLSLDDIRDSNKKGKWWLVGASYRDPAKMANAAAAQVRFVTQKHDQGDNGVNDVVEAGRLLGMNTEVRRAIFFAILLSADYAEAVLKIKKMRLKKNQIEEIAFVILRCVSEEKAYNPYYAVLAREFCHERAIKWALQTALWDYLKRMDIGEDEPAEEDVKALSMSTIVSLGNFYGTLIAKRALSITLLKKVDWGHVQSRTAVFLEVLFTKAILSKASVDMTIEDTLCQIQEVPDTVPGFCFFLTNTVSQSDIPDKDKRKKQVADVCQSVVSRLEQER